MMMIEWPLIFGLLMGMGLSAASGFRLFIPPLVLSIASLFFGLPLPEQMHWIGTQTAFYILLTATLFEIGAYYIPWVDNLLDTIATPAAVIAGTLLTSPFMADLDPFWQWTMALVAGGATAGAVQSLTHVTRLSSTATTGGVANPILATIENILSGIISVLVVLFPIITIAVLIIVTWAVFQATSRLKRLRALGKLPAPSKQLSPAHQDPSP